MNGLKMQLIMLSFFSMKSFELEEIYTSLNFVLDQDGENWKTRGIKLIFYGEQD
jgi:hypothetical protein